MKNKEKEKLDKCVHCGKVPEIILSSGGFTIYYAIHCKCGINTRGKGVMKGLIPMGFSESSNAPQNSEEEAIKRWKEINQ